MIIEYFWYSPVIKKYGRDHLGSAEMIKKMPANIREQLLQHPSGGQNCILVEAKKINIVAFLDDFLKIEQNEFDRTRHIEITEDEICNHDYYYIGLRVLNWGEQITYEFNRPTCKNDACPYGAQIISPTRIKSERIRSLNLAKIFDIWDFGVRFVISEKLKEIFDFNGITGLKYEPCLIEHRKAKKEESNKFEGRFFVAEIIFSVSQRAKNIFLRPDYYCKKHSIIFRYDGICERVTSRDAILQNDFQFINRVIVKGKEYHYGIPMFFVSRKVLNILLANDVTDLRPIGIYFKKGFMPVPFD